MTLTVETPAQTTIVGQSREGDHIHQYRADNGQDIFFTAIEEHPNIKKQDVNFDGREDLVIFTAMGASNFFCRFYVFDGSRYVAAMENDLIVELCNYELYPGKNMVLSSANNGNAGALFEKELYRWNGTQLELVRRAVSEERTMTEFVSGDKFVTTVELDAYHAQVRDFTSGEYEGSIIWEIESVRSLVDAAWLQNVTDALWMGL